VWGDEDAKAEARKMIKQFEAEKRGAASQQVVEQEDNSQPPLIVDTPEDENSLTAFPAPFN